MQIRRSSVLATTLSTTVAFAILTSGGDGSSPVLQARQAGRPYAVLAESFTREFINESDSNSPVVWELVDGVPTVHVLNSMAGQPQLSVGRSLTRLMDLQQVTFEGSPPPGGVWFESVVPASDGTWYAYYHNELAGFLCPGTGKVMPRVGSARSHDRGRTWQDLGPILEASSATVNCATKNHYFVGGVGDLNAMLDAGGQYLYIYFSQYIEVDGRVGIGVARMPWAWRDEPEGRLDVWSDGAWLPGIARERLDPETGEVTDRRWDYPWATPVMAARDRWDNASRSVDVWWGPSIHWNTHLQSYVMLINRAISNEWKQGGIYVSFNPDLGNPTGWSTPEQLLNGGRWYPQVVGSQFRGTDKIAGESARFYMSGRSDYTIQFGRY
jgi:hypothetical protein